MSSFLSSSSTVSYHPSGMSQSLPFSVMSLCISSTWCSAAWAKIPLQLEENHVVPPSSQDEALASYSVSVEALRSILKFTREIDAFELWCWRRLLRVPWTPRRYNQSILKEISPGISLEGMMLTGTQLENQQQLLDDRRGPQTPEAEFTRNECFWPPSCH